MMAVEKLYSSCESADDMDKVLTMLEFRPPSTFDVTTKIEQLKEDMEEWDFETSPATDALLRSFGQNAILHTRNCVAQHKTLTQRQMDVVRKLKDKIWELEGVRLYKKQDLESLGEFMAGRAKEVLNGSLHSADLGYPSTEEEENADTTVTVGQTSEKVEAVNEDNTSEVAGVIFDSRYVKQQMALIRKSIQESQHYIIKAALSRLELDSRLLAEACEEYEERVEHCQFDLGMFELHLNTSLMIEYADILRKSGRYNVLGVVGLVEDGVFPRYPAFNKRLELAIKDYCTKHRLDENDIPSSELRRLKWLSAASLDMGNDGVLARMNQVTMMVFIDWTPEMLADFVVRLASAVDEILWNDGEEPAMADEIMAADNYLIPNEYKLGGFAMPGMYGICQLLPIGFSPNGNFSWTDESVTEKYRNKRLTNSDGTLKHRISKEGL